VKLRKKFRACSLAQLKKVRKNQNGIYYQIMSPEFITFKDVLDRVIKEKTKKKKRGKK